MIGGGKGIRTLDPNVANVVLSQLSYAPTGIMRDTGYSLFVIGYGSKNRSWILDKTGCSLFVTRYWVRLKKNRYWIRLVIGYSLFVIGYGFKNTHWIRQMIITPSPKASSNHL